MISFNVSSSDLDSCRCRCVASGPLELDGLDVDGVDAHSVRRVDFLFERNSQTIAQPVEVGAGRAIEEEALAGIRVFDEAAAPEHVEAVDIATSGSWG